MLIPWSGGIDSSVALHDALYWWWSNKSIKWEVYDVDPMNKHVFSRDDQEPRALIFECDQISAKQEEMQKKAREKLCVTFRRNKWSFEQATIKLETGYKLGGINGTFPQPVMWLSIAALIIKDKEPLVMGWIRGDDATAKISKLRELWGSLTSINGKKCPLIMPYHAEHKYDMIARAKQQGIFTKCWYCEMPTDKGKPCKNCDSCLAMIGAQAVVKHKETYLKISRTR